MKGDLMAALSYLEDMTKSGWGEPLGREAANRIRKVVYFLNDFDSVMWIEPEYSNDGSVVPGTVPEDDDYKLVSTRTKTGRTDWNRAYWDGKRWIGNIGTAEVYAWADIEPWGADGRT